MRAVERWKVIAIYELAISREWKGWSIVLDMLRVRAHDSLELTTAMECLSSCLRRYHCRNLVMPLHWDRQIGRLCYVSVHGVLAGEAYRILSNKIV